MSYKEKFIEGLAKAIEATVGSSDEKGFARQCVEDVETGYLNAKFPKEVGKADLMLAETISIYSSLNLRQGRRIVQEARAAAETEIGFTSVAGEADAE